MTLGNVSTIVPGETPCLECFRGWINDELLPSCAVVGVHPSILSIVASIEVSEAVRIITGKKPLLTGKLLLCDIGGMFFEIINISKAKNCPVCGSSSRPPKPIKEKFITELCSREEKKTFLIAPRENLNIDIDKLASLIISLKEFSIKVKANMGITFTEPANDRTISILKSGIMIAVSFNEEDAYNLYKEILVDGFGMNVNEITNGYKKA